MATPPNLTSRLWVRYTSLNYQHEILFRHVGVTVAATAVALVIPILTAMADLMRTDDSFYAARFSAPNSDISLPVDITPIHGTGSNGGVAGDPESRYITFVGRGTGSGARVRWTLFAGSDEVGVPPTMRYQPESSSLVDAVIEALQFAATFNPPNAFLATDQADAPQVYTYANMGYNYHWTRVQRG